MNNYLKVLRVLNRSEKRRLALMLLCAVAMSLVDVIGISSILPFLSVAADPGIIQRNGFLATIYQATNAQNALEFISLLGMAALAVVVISNAVAFAAQWIIVWYSFDLGRSLSTRLFERYIAQPYEFFLTRNSFNLMLNTTGEVEGVVNGILLPGMQVIARSMTAFFLISLVVLYNPALAMVFLCIIGGAYVLIFSVTQRYVAYFGERSHEANRIRYRKAKEAFGAMKELRILGRESYYKNQFVQNSRAYGRNSALHSIVAMAPRYALETMGIVTMLIVILYNADSERNLAATIPMVALYAITGYRLMPAFQAVFNGLTVIRFNQPSLDIIVRESSHWKDVEEQVEDNATGPSMSPLHAISLRGVSSRYEGMEIPALNAIDVDIPVRQAVGIVGESGAGKSTFLDVLTGLLPMEKGSISIDSAPLRKSDMRRWRNSIGYVPQQIFLADDTIMRNIAFGIADAEIDSGRVERAAKLASIHDFIIEEMPDKYGTVVGENGARLSGGQRQRLGIARALYRDPPVLVFDEATSALDGITEDAVIDAIRELSSSKTIIIIAHRLATVQHCDNIYLLEKGQVVDQGNYADLLSRNDTFRRMAKLSS